MDIRAEIIRALTGGTNMERNGSSHSGGGSNHINTAFVMLPTRLLVDVAENRISEAAYCLYSLFRFWEGQKDDLWYGIPTMAKRTGFSEGKVKRLIKELLAAGHIARQKRMGANWRTKCRTYVGKDRTVFVAGEPANGGMFEKSKGSCAANNEVEVEQAINGTNEQRDERETAWMKKVEWTPQRQIRFDQLQKAYNSIEAKRVFLEELSWDSLEMEQVYQEEFPDSDADGQAEPLF